MTGTRAQQWEERYSAVERLWSGEPNEWLTGLAAAWEPGTALDLGCGEGADALWLAGRGWHVTALDVSATAVARLRAEAARRGLSQRVTALVRDVGVSLDGTGRSDGVRPGVPSPSSAGPGAGGPGAAGPDAAGPHATGSSPVGSDGAGSGAGGSGSDLPGSPFDLVTCFYVHGGPGEGDFGPVHLLARAAHLLAPGGRLLTAVHAVNPPWHQHHDRTWTASEILEGLARQGLVAQGLVARGLAGRAPTAGAAGDGVVGSGSAPGGPEDPDPVTHGWEVVVAEERWREVRGPQGQEGRRTDAVVCLRLPSGTDAGARPDAVGTGTGTAAFPEAVGSEVQPRRPE